MGRSKKAESKVEETVKAEIVSEPAVTSKDTAQETVNISKAEKELMRLYPQYEKFWITPRGFVHPEGTPEYLLKGAKLIENIYHKNKS